MATQSTRPMVSETSICNQALSWVGANSITSLDDPSAEAEWCNSNYHFLRDAVLEERMWSFAKVKTTSVSATLDEWGDKYKHAIPLDWVSVFYAYIDLNKNTSEGWEKVGRYVESDDSTLYLQGLKRVTDTGYFSALFVQALVARMSAEMAVPLTGDHKKAAYHWTLYGQKLADAATRDGQQGTNTSLASNTLVNARGG